MTGIHVSFGFLAFVYLEVVFLGFRVNFIRNFAVQSIFIVLLDMGLKLKIVPDS